MSSADFWKDRAAADGAIRELGILNDTINRYHEIEDGIAALEKAGFEKNFDEGKFFELKRKFKEFELKQLFVGPYDAQAAVLAIYPGAGGEDAEDWARMLGADV